MSQPTYKLYYFDVKALGESIRMLFAYGGIEYEDIGVSEEDWIELKPSMYFPYDMCELHKCSESINRIVIRSLFFSRSNANGTNASPWSWW